MCRALRGAAHRRHVLADVPTPTSSDPIPTISVALCTYNGERFLPALLESLRAQIRLPDELVVCDDSSSDGTLAIVEAFAEDAPFPVVVHRNARNLGPTTNFEEAATLCRNELIAFCDQDDVWFPEKIHRAVEAFTAEPDISFSFSDGELIDAMGGPLGTGLWDAQGFGVARRQVARNGDLMRLLVLHTFVTGATMVIRADLRSIAFPIPRGWVHDAWLALVGAFVGSYRMIEEPLLYYRVHPEQVIGVPGMARIEETPLRRWRRRLAHAFDLRSTDVRRLRKRIQSDLYAGAAERFAEASDRYITAVGGRPHAEAEELLRDLRDRAEHLKLRGNLPDRRARRVRLVFGEVRNGRYRRYSASVLNAVEDLLY